MTKREMLVKCRETFARYALNHRKQAAEARSPDRREKKLVMAAANEKLVEEINEVLGEV